MKNIARKNKYVTCSLFRLLDLHATSHTSIFYIEEK